MPDHAWFNFWAMRQYPDLTNEEMGIPNLGDPNVTFPDWKVMEERRAYYASLSYADQQLGRVLTELQELGLAESTIVVFWGDHGYQLGEHTEWMKTTNFEIANWVPLMLRVPGSTKEGSSTDELVEMVDLFPTLVEAAGLPPLNLCSEKDSTKTKLCTEGASLMPLVEGGESAEMLPSGITWQMQIQTQIQIQIQIKIKIQIQIQIKKAQTKNQNVPSKLNAKNSSQFHPTHFKIQMAKCRNPFLSEHNVKILWGAK